MQTSFRRPLGIAFSGGGSFGAWQAGLLHRWVSHGLSFDHVWGFSAGALNGAAYLLNRLDDAARTWQALEGRRTLRLAPRHWPDGLFSDRPLRGMLGRWVGDQERARREAACRLHVVSLHREEAEPYVASFGPDVWEGPLIENLVASCAIPMLFPPVRMKRDGRTGTYVDGGWPGRRWLDLAPLRDCKDVILVSVARPDELARWPRGPLDYVNLRAKRIVHRQMESARLSLAELRDPPRLFPVVPSRPLSFFFLNFSGPKCRDAYRLGEEDAEAFLDNRRA